MDFKDWFVTSSSDPLKFSLSIRGMAVMGAGWALSFQFSRAVLASIAWASTSNGSIRSLMRSPALHTEQRFSLARS
jgi:hypothetical protein